MSGNRSIRMVTSIGLSVSVASTGSSVIGSTPIWIFGSFSTSMWNVSGIPSIVTGPIGPEILVTIGFGIETPIAAASSDRRIGEPIVPQAWRVI